MSNPRLFDDPRTLLVPQGEFELVRNPADGNLQAWDSADEFLLNHVHELQILSASSSLLIVNDAFGALAVALAGCQVFSWNDSVLAQQALVTNLVANGYLEDQVTINRQIEFPSAAVDCVLLKIPKSLALLEYQLFALRPLLHHNTYIVAAGMSRFIHTSTLKLFETIIGPTTTTRARKKSRLVMVERDQSLNGGQSRYPDSYEVETDRVYRLINHASLFSRDRLDLGTQLLIEHLPAGEQYRNIVDLGCGNGILGIIAATINPVADLLFCDESHMAIASARENFFEAFAQQRNAEFMAIDCLQGVPGNSQNLVVVNPPFHQQHSVGDTIAWNMFKDAHRVLMAGGELYLVGNRHLAYHAKLKKLFGNCTTVASTSKFVVLASVKRQ